MTRTSTISMAIAISVLALMLAMPLIANQGIVFFAAVTYIYIVFAFSWNLMFGYTGMASFGHGAFFAIGAYGGGILVVNTPGLHFLLVLLLAAAMGLAVGIIVGFVVRRATGVYFAILTIALAQLVYLTVSHSGALGRDDGYSGIIPPVMNLGFASVDLSNNNSYYYFIVAVTLATTAGLWRLVHGPIGRRLRSIQQDSQRAEFLGVNIAFYRILSFSVAGMVAALMGALYAPYLRIATPEFAYFVFSAQPVLYTMLGGMHSFWGPAAGGLIFGILTYLTRTLSGFSEI
ncbi:MAG: branched-chain amino acid ABC transporter permease, partial [Rhodobacterales bacterium]|nr:branched-chain amino acid ABC transporter permease [Rhodobacterales bacterium]